MNKILIIMEGGVIQNIISDSLDVEIIVNQYEDDDKASMCHLFYNNADADEFNANASLIDKDGNQWHIGQKVCWTYPDCDDYHCQGEDFEEPTVKTCEIFDIFDNGNRFVLIEKNHSIFEANASDCEPLEEKENKKPKEFKVGQRVRWIKLDPTFENNAFTGTVKSVNSNGCYLTVVRDDNGEKEEVYFDDCERL